MNILERLIFPTGLAEFENRYLFKEPFAQADSVSCYRGILSWEMLSKIIECHHDCWLPRHGKLPHEKNLSRGSVSFSEAISAYKAGRTILVRHSEKANSQIGNIGDAFARAFNCPIDIQLYYTPEGQQGFDWHYDVEDVFIIQSVGSKEFRLKKNTMSQFPYDVSKMRKDFLREKPGPELRCLLEAGDLLYIPAGWWHCAQAVTDSAHLSVGILAASRLPTLVCPIVDEHRLAL